MLNELKNIETIADFMSSQLVSLREKNPRFSLRSFANKINSSPSFLSEVMNGKKKLSTSKALEISRYLNLTVEQSEYFSLLTQYESEPDELQKLHILEKLNNVKPTHTIERMELEIFRTISEWYHVSILELSEIPKFKMTPESVAKALKIDRFTAKQSIDRLVELGLLQADPDGNLEKTKKSLVFESETRSKALQNFHNQTLELSKSKLKEHPPSERIVGTQTFAFSSQDLGKASQILKKALQDIDKLAAKSKNKDAVYHLGVQMVRFSELLQ